MLACRFALKHIRHRYQENCKSKGAQILVSPAAWEPGVHDPNGEWGRSTLDTGLPLFVCNRTGQDDALDFTDAESVVAQAGKRLASFRSKRSTAFVFDWNKTTQSIASGDVRKIALT